MAELDRLEGGIYQQAFAKDYTPIAVSADFGALARLQAMKSNVIVAEFPKVTAEVAKAA